MKLKRLFLGLVTMMIMSLGLTVMSYADDVSKATEIVPIDATSREEMDAWQISMDFIEDFNTNGRATGYYKFTIENPSYVTFKAYAETGNFVDETLHLSQSEIFADEVLTIYGETAYATKLLEKGTYYLKYDAIRKYSSMGAGEDGQMLLSVFKNDLVRTGKTDGLTRVNAININNGKYGESFAYGVVSETVTNQWFRIDVKSKSDVTINLAEIVTSKGIASHFSSILYKVNGDSLDEIEDAYQFEKLNGTYTLEKGTYYVNVNKVNWITGQIKISVKIKDVYAPDIPDVKSYKSGYKYIKGNAEVGTTVYTKIGKKIYEAKTNKYGVFNVKTPVLKVKNKITIYAKDDFGNKSNTIKLTVKNRKLTSPKVKTAKKNTKLVKGTAKKGTTVYVTYGGKTVKKKVTSKNFSIKVSKKLKKGTAVKVKIVDSYGNYSKTVTYMVK